MNHSSKTIECPSEIMVRIIEALIDDKWVRSLDLTSNSLSNSIIGEFIDLLKVNSSLRSVTVDDNRDLDHGMVALLQTILSQRQDDQVING